MENRIKSDMTASLKNGDTIRLSVLRMVINDIKNKKINDGLKELEDEKVLAIIQKMVKQHKESIEQFNAGNRADLAQKEAEEMKILEGYLPEELSNQEIDEIISSALKKTGASSIKDMGKVMAMAMESIKGRADGKVISQKVKDMLVQKGEK